MTPNPCQHWDHCDCDEHMAECEASWKRRGRRYPTVEQMVAHWNRTGKCLRHIAIDEPPLFCEQCGKSWKSVVDGRKGRTRRYLEGKARE